MASLNPYKTPKRGLYLFSSTPPVRAVHGMCGHFAAQSVILRSQGRVGGQTIVRFSVVKFQSTSVSRLLQITSPITNPRTPALIYSSPVVIR